jgi:nucleoside-diphosphate-sugar epimerase
MSDMLVIGRGYLGARVADRYREAGWRVLATTRSESHAEEFRALGLIPLVCDVTDPSTLGALPAVALCVYCVGLDRSSGQSMRQVYVDGLASVLDRLPPPGKLIHVSSTSVYGQTGGEEVDEEAATEPQEESGKVVLEAETVLRSRFPRAILLRFAGIYGPGRLLRSRALRAGEPIMADPHRWVNLIHVEDGASAVLAAADRGHPGEVYNVSDGHPVRRHDFFTLLAELLAAPPPRFVPPDPNTLPPHEQAHRRISNRKLCQKLNVCLNYPNYQIGLRASV